MIAKKKSVAGKRLHEPVCCCPETVSVVINGRCDDRPEVQQRLSCSFQGRELRAFEMKFDESRRQTQAFDPTCPDATSTSSGELRRIVEAAMERNLTVAVRNRTIVNCQARIIRQQSVEILLKAGAAGQIRLDSHDLPEFALGVPDKCFDHNAMMSAGVKQDFVAAQCGDNFRDEKPVACGYRGLGEIPFLAQPAPRDKLQMMSARYVIIPS